MGQIKQDAENALNNFAKDKDLMLFTFVVNDNKDFVSGQEFLKTIRQIFDQFEIPYLILIKPKIDRKHSGILPFFNAHVLFKKDSINKEKIESIKEMWGNRWENKSKRLAKCDSLSSISNFIHHVFKHLGDREIKELVIIEEIKNSLKWEEK